MGLLTSRKEPTRRRIVDTAARLFLEKGVDRVGVDEIMRECGLTHGGFYGHFPSKEALVSEACTAALQQASSLWQELARELYDDAAWANFSARYLAGDLTSPDNPACAAAILGADVARRHDSIQGNATLIRSLIDTIAAEAGSDRPHAILSIAVLVGATSIAAQVAQDKAFAAEIFNTSRERLVNANVRCA